MKNELILGAPYWDRDRDRLVVLVHNQRMKLKHLTIQVKVYRHLKDAYMRMLLHLNEDFDDDLLQDSIQLIS